jgi:Fe-S oxidoreductase
VTKPVIENNLRAERIAAGFATVERLAERAGLDPVWCSYIEDGRVLATAEEYRALLDALGGIPANRIYDRTWRQLTLIDPAPGNGMTGPSQMWRKWRDEGHLLISRDELNYYDTQPGADHSAEVYVNMSCGTQRSPHLLQDTVGVLQALGVSFVAAAGPSAGCCGKPIMMNNSIEAFERHRQCRVERSQAWGATTQVNWCGACQQVGTSAVARQELTDGSARPVREIQVLPFLAEQLRALGDKIPWQKAVRRRVLAEGHPGMSNVHAEMHRAIVGLLSMVPGVEVVGMYDGWWADSPCALFGLEGSAPPAWTLEPETAAEIEQHRQRLAVDIRSRGADTVASMHFACHQMWSRYASDDLDVVNPVSILAEALGRAHPDRYQEATRHGDTQRLLVESRPRWQEWGMTEQRATEMAESICRGQYVIANVAMKEADPASYAMTRRLDAGSFCGGCGGCGNASHYLNMAEPAS